MGVGMPGSDIDSVVARYAGEPRAAARTGMMTAPGLKGKLSELAGQLAAVQNENEAIRGRYLELEDAWQGMIEENKRVHATNDELREQLSNAEAANAEKDASIEALTSKVTALAQELARNKDSAKKAVNDLKEEQLVLGKKNVEADMLRRESMTLDMEGRKLR